MVRPSSCTDQWVAMTGMWRSVVGWRLTMVRAMVTARFQAAKASLELGPTMRRVRG